MNNGSIINFSNDNMDEQNGFSPTLLTLAAVLTFIIMVIGIFGNFLTVVALLKCPKVRNVAAAFIISLCLADLLFCALVLPFSAFRFIEGTWTHGDVLCKLIPFIQYGNIGVSLLCIAMITINRYVMIAHHNSYSKIYKKHWIAVMIGFCWLFSYGMQLPTLLGVWGVFDYDPKLGTCSIMNDAQGRSSKTALFITAFFFPCLIIIACYTKIFWIVHKSELRLKNHAHKQNSIPNNQRPIASLPNVTNDQNSKTLSNVGSDTSSSTNTKQESLQKQSRIKDQRDLRAKRNEWRITKMVLAIFLSFLICYLPITLAKVADKNVEYPAFHIFSYIMLYLSACINPIIYVIMNKQYRKAYKTVLMCEPSRLLPFGKAVGGSSVGEMERYRVEQQPQPHNGISNVDGGSTKYQLQQFSTNPNCHRDDNPNKFGECKRQCSANEVRQNERCCELRPECTEDLRRCSEKPSNYEKTNNVAADQLKPFEDNDFKRYNSRGGNAYRSGDQKAATSRNSERFERSKCSKDWNSEQNPILWSKHQRHSR